TTCSGSATSTPFRRPTGSAIARVYGRRLSGSVVVRPSRAAATRCRAGGGELRQRAAERRLGSGGEADGEAAHVRGERVLAEAVEGDPTAPRVGEDRRFVLVVPQRHRDEEAGRCSARLR